jgi:hypothetical protein
MDGNKGTLESQYLGLVWKSGLYPSTLAHLSNNIPGSLPK